MLAPLRFIANHPLTADRRWAAYARFLTWQISSRLFGEQTFHWIEGAKLVVRNGMTGATGNIYCGLHEFANMAFVLHVLRPDDLLLDVGANIGSYTILAAQVCGADAAAFEPDPGTATALRRNVAANDLGARVVVHEAAVGAQAGEVAFTVGHDTTNHVAITADASSRLVRQVRLDDVVNVAGPALMKLDVEGYEAQVLHGAEATLADPRLFGVITECQDPGIVDVLGRHGFSRAYYAPETRTLTREPETPYQSETGSDIFLRDWEMARIRISSAPRRRVVGKVI